MSVGVKDDGLGVGNGGVPASAVKPRWDLLPWDVALSVVDVLTYGAEKYAPGNWRSVDGWRWRYFRAGVGHVVSWWFGEHNDLETGLPHLSHAICCVLFLLGKELEPGGGLEHYARDREALLIEAVRRAREYKEKMQARSAA